MISTYLYEYLGSGVITGREEKEGRLIVDGQASGTIWLRRGGVLELGPLNAPLGPYLRFDGGGVFRSSQLRNGQWQPVTDDEISEGLHLFLLLDPRTYDKLDGVVDSERSQISIREFGVFVLATYPVEEMFKHLSIPDGELICTVDMLGRWWQTHFTFGRERMDMFVRDPLFSEGVVVQFDR